MELFVLQPTKAALSAAVQTVLQSLRPAVPGISFEIDTSEETGIRCVLFHLGIPGISGALLMCPTGRPPAAEAWELVCTNTFSSLAEGATLAALVTVITPATLFAAYARAFGQVGSG